MFTGIVQGIGTVTALVTQPGLTRVTVALPLASQGGIERGASISLNGVCLTVTTHTQSECSFDIMSETLKVTTLSDLKVGSKVNVERSRPGTAEIGGHILSGHIDGRATVSEIQKPENNYVITFQVPAQLMKYIFAKGYVALNGASLTVVNPNYQSSTFEVWLIPETLTLTTFGTLRVNDGVNIEVDRTTQTIVDTVWRFLEQHGSQLLKISKSEALT